MGHSCHAPMEGHVEVVDRHFWSLGGILGLFNSWGVRCPKPSEHLVPSHELSNDHWGVFLSLFQDKLNRNDFDDSLNTEEDRILKPCSSPRDFIDKLVVNFENFLEEVSTEESGKGQKNILGGEKNEYVISPCRPYCPPGKDFAERPLSTKISSRKSQNPCSGMLEGTCSEAKKQLLSSAQSVGPDHLCEEGTPNPYLKNSVTTGEFFMSEKLLDQTKRED